MYVDGKKYVGRIALVGEFDTVNNKTVLRIHVSGEHGSIPSVLWLDKTDGKTVNGAKLPSSFERADSLCRYLTGKPLSPATKHMMAASDKGVEFTASKRVTNNGHAVFDAKYVNIPSGLQAYNAPSAATLSELFGAANDNVSLDTAHAPSAPSDSDIPF